MLSLSINQIDDRTENTLYINRTYVCTRCNLRACACSIKYNIIYLQYIIDWAFKFKSITAETRETKTFSHLPF